MSESTIEIIDVQTITPINWNRKWKWQASMFDDFGRSCALSGKKHNITLDHVLPKQPGRGRNSKGNMLPITINLNSSKHTNNLFDWFYANHVRLGLSEERFIAAIQYLANQNGMTIFEYYLYYQKEYALYLKYKSEVSE